MSALTTWVAAIKQVCVGVGKSAKDIYDIPNKDWKVVNPPSELGLSQKFILDMNAAIKNANIKAYIVCSY
jgi:hypothetical protein